MVAEHKSKEKVKLYQKVILVGNLGRDPELKYSPDGTPVASFSMATSEKWTGQDGEQRERTCWWRISAWKRMAETCNQYLSKGSRVLVEGRMNPDPETGGPRVYTKNDGSSGSSFEVTALTVKFLNTRSDGGSSSQPKDEDVPAEVSDDAIPF